MTTTTPVTATDEEADPGAGAGAVDVDGAAVDAPPVNAKHLAAVLDAAWAAVTVTSDDKDHAKRTKQQPEPTVEPPPALKAFTRWTSRKRLADDKMLAALDDDDTFRTRITELLDPDTAGELGWLWLTRPEGWDIQIAGIIETTESELDAEQAERSHRDRVKALENRVKNTERKAATASKRRAQAAAEIRTAKRALSAAQRRHQTAHRALAAAQSALDKAQTDADESSKHHTSADRALHRAKDADRTAAQSETKTLTELEEALAALDTELHPPKPKPARKPKRTRKIPEPPARRTAIAIPATANTGPEVAQHLIGTPGTAWLIDGYNFAFRLWEDTGNNIKIARGRVEQHMNVLAARFHLDLTVVWDGIQDPTASRVPHRHGPQPGAATIRFSRPGRTADDSIIIDCDTMATTRQIVVVTADRNLRLRAARRGANTIKPEHLAALMADTPTEPVPGQHHLIGATTEPDDTL